LLCKTSKTDHAALIQQPFNPNRQQFVTLKKDFFLKNCRPGKIEYDFKEKAGRGEMKKPKTMIT